jgi:nicotinamidase-related amidase
MCLRDITTQLPVPTNVAIVGIESHVCVLQTTLDLLKAGHAVYVISDGVSSANREEVPIALARMRQAGALISTSESFVSLICVYGLILVI